MIGWILAGLAAATVYTAVKENEGGNNGNTSATPQPKTIKVRCRNCGNELTVADMFHVEGTCPKCHGKYIVENGIIKNKGEVTVHCVSCGRDVKVPGDEYVEAQCDYCGAVFNVDRGKVYKNNSSTQSSRTKSDFPQNDSREDSVLKKISLSSMHGYREYKRVVREKGIDTTAELTRLLPIAATQLEFNNNSDGFYDGYYYRWNAYSSNGYEYCCVASILRYMLEKNMLVNTWVYKEEYRPLNLKNICIEYNSKMLFGLPFRTEGGSVVDMEGGYDTFIHVDYYPVMILPGIHVKSPEGAYQIEIPIKSLYEMIYKRVEGLDKKIRRHIAIIIDDSYIELLKCAETSLNDANSEHFSRDILSELRIPKYKYIQCYYNDLSEADRGENAFDDSYDRYGESDDGYAYDQSSSHNRRNKAEDIAEYYGWDNDQGDPWDYLDNM